ncbi:hypothetical protein [Gynurincola endophyticus]|uniref:hypothetical protein n=1 Tax=Gynurincola endophyticus TaxID=2479004 RepID=UPI000F8D175E|nr:hypothetical protein [Gynurincola endophyticus]
MKTLFQIEINLASKKVFFPEERIKNKYKILEILLEACRYIIYSEKEKKVRGSCKMILNTDKMKRIFFISEYKMYSIVFPFNIHYDGRETIISYKNIIDIDSRVITTLLSIIKSPVAYSENCLDFIDPVLESEEDGKINYWPILRDLIFIEEGYLRYDRDLKGYQEALENEQQHRHPLNHIDIFYTNQATFKLGLEQECLEVDFIDTLDSNTNCKYLKSVSSAKKSPKK